jgi:excisionase family DNA binding protein
VLVLDSVKPEKWYSVKEAADILGFSRDTVIRQIDEEFLKAFTRPYRASRRLRIYQSRRIQGVEKIRYIKT